MKKLLLLFLALSLAVMCSACSKPVETTASEQKKPENTAVPEGHGVTKGAPCCWVSVNGNICLVNADRYVVSVTENEKSGPADLPQAKGLKIQSGSQAGWVLDFETDSQRDAFINLMNKIVSLECAEAIQEIDFSKPAAVTFLLKAGFTVRMGNCGSEEQAVIEDRLQKAIMLKDNLLEMGFNSGIIDTTPEVIRFIQQ